MHCVLRARRNDPSWGDFNPSGARVPMSDHHPLAPSGKRDARIDFFRGIALYMAGSGNGNGPSVSCHGVEITHGPKLGCTPMQYQTLRSVSDHHIFVVCRDGTFYEAVPVHVRKQGPWQGMHRGDVDRLEYEHRLALARDGYALVQCELAVFKPEVCST